jgi:sugar lactone lactonase YvrE
LLYWVDCRAPAVKRIDLGTGAVAVQAVAEVIGSIAFREKGGLLAATKSGIHLFDPDSGALAPLARPEAHLPDNRFNDGRCDRQGRFWAGTMSDVRRDPVGTLYRLDTDLSCTPLRNAIIIPNSLAWSPDGRTMYFADTNRHTIWAWDYDPATGAATRERVFADTGAGRPDGSCVDADGCLWNAEYGAARIVRYTPGGKVDRAIGLPVDNPTCCCFGGSRLDELFITSARQRLGAEDLARQPLAGSVLAVRPGVRGLPEARFAG